MVELKAPKAVIFDWDNTLVDTWPLIHKALHKTFIKYDLRPWTLEETKSKVAHSLRDSFPVLFGEIWEEAGKDYQQFYRDHHLQELEILPFSEDVLKYLHDKGIHMVVVSNKRGDSLRKEVASLGWEKYFDRLIGADDAKRDKPHPDPVHMALEGSGIQPGDDVWFIGDTVIDLECAKNTACAPILYGAVIPEVTAEGVHYQGFDAHCHAPTHEDLLQLFKQVL